MYAKETMSKEGQEKRKHAIVSIGSFLQAEREIIFFFFFYIFY